MFYLEITHQAGLGPCAGSTNFVTPVTESLSRTGESLGLLFIYCSGIVAPNELD